MAVSVVVRCDGGFDVGMGHVSRCLALADELRDEHRTRVIFVMRDPEGPGVVAVKAQGYDVEELHGDRNTDYGPALQQIVTSRGARTLVVDVRDRLSRASLDAIRATGVRVVTIDDESDRRLASDLAFYPPVPQVEETDWRGFTGQRYAGWEWVILRREFAASHHVGADPCVGPGADTQVRPYETGVESASSAAIDILVTMGGSDPAGMTEFTVRALDLLAMPYAIRIAVGPAFSRAELLIDAVVHSKHSIHIARAPEPLAPLAALMRASRIAIASFGVTAYELAACGVPAVHLCLTDDHARSSSAFDREGIAITAGVLGRVTPTALIDAVSRLMGNAGRRTEMVAHARRLVDGRGAQRVAERIVASIRQGPEYDGPVHRSS